MNHQFFFLSSLAAVLLSLSGCSAPPLPPSADNDELLLSGSVRTLAVTEFNAIRENGQMIPLDTLTVRTVFLSPDGRIEKVIHENGEEHYFYSSGCRTIKRYNLDGEPDHDEIARYDTQGNMISWGMYGADGTVMSREVYTYCGGRCVEKRIQDGDVSPVIVCRDYRYDEAGNSFSTVLTNRTAPSLMPGDAAMTPTEEKRKSNGWTNTTPSSPSPALPIMTTDSSPPSRQTSIPILLLTFMTSMATTPRNAPSLPATMSDSFIPSRNVRSSIINTASI